MNEAQRALVESHIRYAYGASNRYCRSKRISGALRDDVQQQAMIGLIRAAQCYRPDRDTSFKTYASYCIGNTIARWLLHQNDTRFGGVCNVVSLDQADEGDKPIGDRIANDDPSPEDLAERASLSRRIREAASDAVSTPTEFAVLFRRLIADEPQMYREIGESLGVSKQRVYQVEVKALGKIKRALTPIARELGMVD